MTNYRKFKVEMHEAVMVVGEDRGFGYVRGRRTGFDGSPNMITVALREGGCVVTVPESKIYKAR